MKFLIRIAEKYSEIYKILLFIISIIIVVLQFPREGKFKYEFYKGKPWMHDDLIAPFDFAVLKSDQDIHAEKEAALENTKLYFSVDTAVSSLKEKAFKNDFNKKWDEKYQDSDDDHKQYSLNAGLAILDSIYAKGIIQLNEQLDDKDNEFVINVVNLNVSEEKELSSLFSIQTADDYVIKGLSLQAGIDAELLTPLLENAISQNIFYDADFTTKYRQEIVSSISLTRGMVQKNERIISKGDLVTSEKFQMIESLKREYEKQLGSSSKYFWIFMGQLILIFISYTVLFLFIFSFRREVFLDNKKVFFILLNIFFMVLVTSLVIKVNVDYLYIVPLCLVPVIIRAFFDTRLALFVHIVTVIITGFLVPNSFEFIFLQLIAGIIAIISIVNLRKRSQFFMTTILVFATYSATYTGMMLMQDGSFSEINANSYIWFAGSSLLVLFSYPLIYIFEKIFGLVTDVSLLELSDINTKLLRELGQKAPATLQHSLQVANLAEDAIFAVGGNTLLTRAGALYHDVGKMDMALYFTENQGGGVNPHEELTSEESAAIIISHVRKGIEHAKKHNLPERVIDFIRSHHGTRRTLYFYNQFLKNNPDEPVDETRFRYHGPIPFSKESAVVMMADAIEAASRSMKKPDEETISNLVENIINSQIELKQYVNSDITFRDVAVIKKIFKRKLQNMFHVRVEYTA
ncbi:MAG: HDIG domain-containing metalloprotein [Bacteroidota bacterium]